MNQILCSLILLCTLSPAQLIAVVQYLLIMLSIGGVSFSLLPVFMVIFLYTCMLRFVPTYVISCISLLSPCAFLIRLQYLSDNALLALPSLTLSLLGGFWFSAFRIPHLTGSSWARSALKQCWTFSVMAHLRGIGSLWNRIGKVFCT